MSKKHSRKKSEKNTDDDGPQNHAGDALDDGTVIERAQHPEGEAASNSPEARENTSQENLAASGEAETELDRLRRQLQEKTQQAQGYLAQVQRLQADFENYKKRQEIERSQIEDRVRESFISGLLETLDNFDRAAESLAKLPGHEAKGIMMIHDSLLAYLHDCGLERISSVGQQFDPFRHDAVMQAEAEAEEGTVLEEFQRGYSVKGKVVRPSKVKVARGMPGGNGNDVPGNSDNAAGRENAIEHVNEVHGKKRTGKTADKTDAKDDEIDEDT